jgi:hypothetical protein
VNREIAEQVVEIIRTQLKEEFNVNADLRLSDHTYDNLPEGAWTVSYEGFRGSTPWPYELELAPGKSSVPKNVFIEAINHYSVGLFDYYEI